MRLIFACVALIVLAACNSAGGITSVSGPAPDLRYEPFLDTVEVRTFRWFWETTNPKNGLVPDRWPTKSFSSVAAIGFGLTSYLVGVEHGWVTREQARDRVL